QQVATSSSLAASSVVDEVAWSQDAAHYHDVLQRLSGLRDELARAVPATRERHSTRLLDLSPPGTVFYAAVPNLGETLATGRQSLETRTPQDEMLRSGWAAAGPGVDSELDAAFEEVRRFGSALGEEVAVSISQDASGDFSAPLLTAELKDPAGLHASLARLAASHGTPPVRLIEGDLPMALDGAGTGSGDQPATILFWVRDGIVAASPSLEVLHRFAAAPVPPAPSPFLDRIADSYRQGAQYIVAADLHAIVR